MRLRALIREGRVGNSYILSARVRDSIDCVRDMSRAGRYFYDLDGVQQPSGVGRVDAWGDQHD